MTQTLLQAGLVNAALALVLAIPAALASRYLRRWPALVHGAWLLVLLKLVTPPIVEVPLFSTRQEATTPEARCPYEPSLRREQGSLPSPRREQGEEEPLLALPARSEEPLPAHPALVPTPLDWQTPLLVAWLSGAAVVWYLAFARLGRLERLLAQLAPADDDLQRRVARLSERLGLRRAPRLWLVPGVVPPLLLAVVDRPRLLVPTGLWHRLDDDQRDALLLHELAHLRRGDPWVRLLELAVVGLFWWYPLAWRAGRALRDAEESCCDAWVLWAAPGAAVAYADALVETVGFLSGARATLPLVASGAAPVRHLQGRLTMILRHPPSRRLSPVALLALIAVGACVLPMVPGLARTEALEDRSLPTTIEDLVNSSPACQACHQPTKVTGWKDDRVTSTVQHPNDLHQEIVKLLSDLNAQRARVAQTEKRLRDVLKRFEETTGKKPAPAKGADQRIDDLEKKLDGILQELKDLRRQKKAPQAALPNAPASEVVWMNQRGFQIPIRIAPAKQGEVRELLLCVSHDQGKTWETHGRAQPSARAFDFHTVEDGWYSFVVQVIGKDGRPEPSDPSKAGAAALVVYVDTVRPELELTTQVKGQEVVVGWRVIDDDPDLRTLKFDYRLVNEKRWHELGPRTTASGQFAFVPAGRVAEVRARVSDLAGNSVEGTITPTYGSTPEGQPRS